LGQSPIPNPQIVKNHEHHKKYNSTYFLIFTEISFHENK
jgi:hypothetical protein